MDDALALDGNAGRVPPAMGVVYFVVLVGALIFIHELGHFVAAKSFGVKVLKFSVGFGPRITGTKAGDTEYVIALFPIGGYVRMLGDSPHDVVAPSERHRSFEGQPLWRRTIIVLAGPAMNLCFPLLLFFLVHLGDSQLTAPVIGTVFPDRPADGRLFSGDRVIAIDGEPVGAFEEIEEVVRARPGIPISLRVQRGDSQVEVTLAPARTRRTLELDRTEEVGRLGIDPYRRTPVVGVQPGTPAALAGLKTFDVIVAVGGRPVRRWDDLEEAFGRRRDLVAVTFLRPERVPVLGGLADVAALTPRVANLNLDSRAGTLHAGLEPADAYVYAVELGSPEEAMGLRPGDRIVTVDGRPLRLWATFLADLRAAPEEDHAIAWRRGTTLHRGTLRLPRETGVTEYGQPFERVHVGIASWMPLRVDEGVPNPHPIAYAWRRAWESTAEMVSLTVTSVVRLFQGRLGVQSIGGPLMIFDAAGQAAREGATNYLKLMAFISVNLGLINLLPVPLLDGGHLLFFLIEGVTRRPIPGRVRRLASLVGLLVLLALMILALKNDVDRVYPSDTPEETLR